MFSPASRGIKQARAAQRHLSLGQGLAAQGPLLVTQLLPRATPSAISRCCQGARWKRQVLGRGDVSLAAAEREETKRSRQQRSGAPPLLLRLVSVHRLDPAHGP